MNAEIKAQWTAALRSGEYQQTTGYLRDTTGYCCLGVLCDLAVKAGKVRETHKDPECVCYGVGNSFGSLPDEVLEWAGLDSISPRVLAQPDEFDEPENLDLADLNDDYEFGFGRIADLIDASL